MQNNTTKQTRYVLQYTMILDNGYQILDYRYQIPDYRYQILDTRYWIQYTRYQIHKIKKIKLYVYILDT